MQLKKKTSIRQALGAATCTLLGGTAHAAGQSWDVTTAVMHYEEKDRITVIKPVVYAMTEMPNEGTLSLRGIFDTMTGATPNGAVPTDSVQTFTSPSGDGYTVDAHEDPMVDFKDQRVALGVDWMTKTSPLLTRTLSANISAESDYFSTGGNITFARELNQKMTTISAGLGLTLDRVMPSDGKPKGLESIHTPTPVHQGEDEEEDEGDEGEAKNSIDLLVGVTQVLSRQSLLQINLGLGKRIGYLTDPYKYISVVDNADGRIQDILYEKRPEDKNTATVFVQLAHHFGEDVTHLSYRYYQDDWGTSSNTTELQYRLSLPAGVYLEPSLRFYQQSEADFYHRYLLNTDATPKYASADYRLAALDSQTLALKAGIELPNNQDLSLRYAGMVQQYSRSSRNDPGILKNYDLDPDLEARIVQIQYSFRF